MPNISDPENEFEKQGVNFKIITDAIQRAIKEHFREQSNCVLLSEPKIYFVFDY